MSLESKRTLIFAILKFLRDELKQENITPDFKESLEGMLFFFSNFFYLLKIVKVFFFIIAAPQLLRSALSHPMR